MAPDIVSKYDGGALEPSKRTSSQKVDQPIAKPIPGILKLESRSGDSSKSEKSDTDDELSSRSSPRGEEKTSISAASKRDGVSTSPKTVNSFRSILT